MANIKDPVELRRAGSSETGDFNISELMYPEDLYTDQKKHMVVFFINVPGHSKIGSKLSSANESTLKPYVGKSGSSQTKDFLGVGTVDIGGLEISVAPGYKQLKSAIAMYMPPSWQEQYNANYEKANSRYILNLMLEANAAANGQGTSRLAEAGKSLGKSLLQGTVGKIFSAVAGGEALGNKIMGKMTNPNAEQIFNGMEYRAFEFSWLMAPRSRKEADNILQIINTFKYHMHPELSPGDNNLIFPAEFEIEFYSGGNVNQFVGSLSTCALSSMIVNYTPDNAWSAFKGTDGYPTAITLTLQFVELEPLTKDRFDEWGEGANAAGRGVGGSGGSSGGTSSSPIGNTTDRSYDQAESNRLGNYPAPSTGLMGSAAGLINPRDRN